MPSVFQTPELTPFLENANTQTSTLTSASANNHTDPQTSPQILTAVPGPRATAFLNLHQKTLSTTLRTISYENFAACFPTIARNAEGNLRGLHGAMVLRLEGFAKKDFEALLRERNVIENLNALEELLAEAQRRKSRAVEGDLPPTPPHLLPPTTLLHSHLLPTLQSTQSHLNAKLQTQQSQNVRLAETVRSQQAEIEALVQGLEGRVKDLEDAGGRLAVEQAREEEMMKTGLRGLVRNVEVEMGGL